jgi:hypothetical protein
VVAGIPTVLIAVTLAGAYIPARRAMKLDPLMAPRAESHSRYGRLRFQLVVASQWTGAFHVRSGAHQFGNLPGYDPDREARCSERNALADDGMRRTSTPAVPFGFVP